MKNLTIILLSIFYFLINPNLIKAQTLINENFDSFDSNSWTTIENSNIYYPDQTCSYEGSQSLWQNINSKLQMQVDAGTCHHRFISQQLNLNQDGKYSLEFDVSMSDPSKTEVNIIVAWQDRNNYSYLTIKQQAFQVFVVRNNHKYTFPIKSVSEMDFNNDHSYHVGVNENLNSYEFFIVSNENQATLKTYRLIKSSSMILSNHIGLAVNYFGPEINGQLDNLIVRTETYTPPQIDDVKLSVPFFKQTDSQWANEEYDHASEWSTNPTIKRWGCALSSMTMIMNYHGMDQMLDGSPINPFTLNKWLIGQVDGYVAKGLVNWMATTRLTKQLSEKFHTPKLEYQAFFDGRYSRVREEIDKKSPVILEIAKHFMTGVGYNQDGEIYIQDPAYSYTKFSQYNQDLISMRSFTPSNTDLSYFLMIPNETFDYHLYSESGAELNLQKFTESISADPENDESTSSQIAQLVKPDSGNYRLVVSKDEFGPFNLEMYLYDQDANPTVIKKDGYAGIQPLEFNINFDKEGESSFKQNLTLKEFKTDLVKMRETKNLKSLYAYYRLIMMVDQAIRAKETDLPRHLAIIKRYLGLYSRYMTVEGRTYLNQQFGALKP